MNEKERRPVVDHDTPAPSPATMPPAVKPFTITADVRILRNHLKEAVGGVPSDLAGAGDQGFTILSDEPVSLGGDNAHPPPLLYLVAGIGF